MKVIDCLCLSIMILPLFLSINCSDGKKKSESDAGTFKDTADIKHSLNIAVDPRIELLAVVQFLSNYDERTRLITQFEFPYKGEVKEYFSSYKDHPAVKLFEDMSASGFSFGTPPAAMLYLSNPPELRFQTPFERSLKSRAGGSERLKRFIEELRDFAQKSNFMEFFEAHKGVYSQSIAEAYKQIEGIDFISTLEDYYGMKQHSYNIILAPFFHYGGFAPKIKRKDNTYDIYNICGPSGVENGIPIFGPEERLKHIAWHEFSHSFVNSAVEKRRKQLAKYSSLFEPIAERMRRAGYDNVESYIIEHIVEAITARLIFIHIGEQAGKDYLQYQKSRGFVFVEPLCERLEQYESQRDKYPRFLDFYPELLEVFEELSTKELDEDFYTVPFMGPIAGVTSDFESLIFIVPTHEGDKDVEEKIYACAKKIRDRAFKNSPILTDQEALKQDLSGNSLMIYGTLTGSLWLAQYLTALPVKIKSDKIVVDTVYPGTHLRFITAWPNPQNPKKGVVIYTAQRAEDIVGINSVLHGDKDYVVASGQLVLKKGNYKKEKGKWLFK